MKKRLALLLSALMLLSVLSVTASAADLPFSDVSEDSLYYPYVEYVYENGLMNGTGDTTFDLDLPYTRAMFVTMLGRMEGIDPADYPGTQFKDVAATNWAAPYINWAAENNIVNGVGDGKFAPGNIITEEQYCTIVCRYMDSKGMDFPGATVWTPEIADMDDVHTWAKSSVVNMVYYNLVWLTGDYRYLPQDELTRGTVACYFTDLHRMINTGEVPALTGDAAELDVLDGDAIICILRGGASYIGNWFYFNSYCDSSDTITAPDAFVHDEDGNWTFERVTNPYIHSKEQVVEQGYRYFIADISQSMGDVKQFLERGNDLYLSKPDGLGGFMIDRAHIDADIEDASYKLTIGYYAGSELMYTQETSLHYDGSRWVLGDPVDVCLMYADMDVAWG